MSPTLPAVKPPEANPAPGPVTLRTAAIPASAPSAAPTPAQAAKPARQRPAAQGMGDLVLYLALVGATAGVWWLSRSGLYTAGSDPGYWMGVAGGVMMVLLFAYPLRKRWPALARFGKAKVWFIVHMVLGIGGPLLILAHSTFRVGSINAAVALFSMLLVSASGVAGRFLYLRIHRGLGGERHTLLSLRESLGLADGSAQALLLMAPKTSTRLLAFEQRFAATAAGARLGLLQVLALSWSGRRLRRQCCAEVDGHVGELTLLVGREAWSQDDQLARSAQAKQAVADFVHAVMRVAQFSLVDRLFSLWHVVHIPFVYVMVLCAVAHVVAVHAY